MDSVSHPYSSSSSSTTDRWSYDVFLSFRGTDTRKNFTGHLFSALRRAGVKTFRDDDELERGEEISESLFKVIEESRISIPVFSKNYASSKWCLEELAAMVECKKNIGQKILPIFLDVDPSDVRNQTGSFDEAFRQLKHKKRVEEDKLQRWRGALREAGQLSGWDLAEVTNGDESKLITLVIKEVFQKLSNNSFDVAKYPVGIESRVEDMMGYLQLESDNVLFVGIWGLGGLGKTTIAKAVLNKISCDFECVCFLPDIREDHSKNGIVTLQNKLLRTLHEASDDITIDGQGKSVIKARLHLKKVLLVLDDVDKPEQLEALAGHSDWFKSGSRIIITTRNKHVLEQHQVGLIYEPKELDHDQSLRLFSKHAFCKDQPLVKFMELSKKAVKIARGLPLALEILGSSLFGMEVEEWEDELDKWKKIPSDDFHNRLKLSYDGLDDLGKQLFLDIACFFIGIDKEISITIWKGCGFYPNFRIKVLIHKCLVKIGDSNELSMHDHIRDMGREIVRQEDCKQPGMRSRLWLHKEALDVIKKKTGTSKIEGLQVDSKYWTSSLELSIESIALMSNLRLLRVDNAELEGELDHLPKGLRWLSWKECPLKCMPTAFHLPELVVLHLKGSKFTQFDCLPENKMLLEKLKVLDLSYCDYLTSICNLSGLPCLERLILKSCRFLDEFDESIGCLKRLVFLDMSYCKNLVELPSSICASKCLETLILSCCHKLCKLPDNLGAMESLTVLFLNNTAINRLPDFIGDLKNLTRLKRLDLQYCFELAEIRDFKGLEALEHLNMRECISLERLPDLSTLKSLKVLNLKGCEKLSEIQGLEGLEALEILDMSWCTSLERLPDLSKLKSLKELDLGNCLKLFEIQGFKGLEALEILEMTQCTSLERLPDLSTLKSLKKLDLRFCLKLSEIQGLEGLEALEIVYMIRCTSLERLQDLSKLKSLKKLYLKYCEKLYEIQGLEGLEALEILDMIHCTSLERLQDLSKLKSLKKLYLKYCEKLSEIQGLEGLEALEILDMSWCTSLEILDLSKLKSLKELDLGNCDKLSEIQCVKGLEALEILNMFNCTSLERLPDLSTLKSLKKLDLRVCLKLSEIQGFKGLKALEILEMTQCTSLERLPDLSTLKSLKKLNLRFCLKLSEIQGLEGLEALEILGMIRCTSLERLQDLSKLKSLKKLFIKYCEKLSEIQGLEGLEALEILDMSWCTSLERLPDLSKLKRLKILNLRNCDKLSEIQSFKGLEALEILVMARCTSIERLPDLSNLKELTILDLTNCRNLSKIKLNGKKKSLKELYMGGCHSNLVNSLKNSLVLGAFECLNSMIFPNGKIPDRFTPMKLSHDGKDEVRLYCEVPPNRALLNPEQQRQEHEINIEGVLLCFVFTNQVEDRFFKVEVDVKRNGKHVSSAVRWFRLWVPAHQEDHFYFSHFRDHRLLSVLKEGDEVSFKINGLRVKKAGLHMVYK